MRKMKINPSLEGLKKAFEKIGLVTSFARSAYVNKLSLQKENGLKVDIVFDKTINEYAVLSENKRFFGIISLQDVVSKTMSILK